MAVRQLIIRQLPLRSTSRTRARANQRAHRAEQRRKVQHPRALSLVLGETWSTRPFTPKDFRGYAVHDPIEITVFFQDALHADPEVHGFQLRFTDEEVEYVPIRRRA